MPRMIPSNSVKSLLSIRVTGGLKERMSRVMPPSVSKTEFGRKAKIKSRPMRDPIIMTYRISTADTTRLMPIIKDGLLLGEFIGNNSCKFFCYVQESLEKYNSKFP
jgi:hypothetical protein